MSTKNKIIIGGLVLVALAFYGGMTYGQSMASASAQSFRNANFAGRQGGMRGAGVVSGNIINQDSTSITVQARDGSTRIILVSPSTSVTKSVSGSISDLSIGKTVNAIGTVNSDGSVTAQSIQLRPATTTPKQ
jgi:hypothetical protein